MNIWSKLAKEYLREINRFYSSLNFNKQEKELMYEEDGDTEYLKEIENSKPHDICNNRKLYVIRNVLSKKITDKKFLRKLCIMAQSTDKEMDALAQALIKEKLKDIK